ncbi:MAG: hypothetical protein OES57_07970 [Acidimicrobiia bacterium]|nr:hypothetical protein [Acidimicrobiia bacterium]
MDPHTPPDAGLHHRSFGRRQLLVGAAAAGAVWTAPSIVRRDAVAAAVGSCAPITVNWTSVSGSNPTYTANGSSGTVTITATITANLSTGATPSVFISGNRIILTASGHQIGDYYDVAFSFTDSSGAAVCTASTTIIDIDQNGRGLGCPTNSRFRDEITNLTGPSLVTTPTANVIESPPGTWASNINCKTSDTQQLALAWTDSAGVSGAGFRYLKGTPPGTDTTLDYQLIKVDPVTMCIETTGSGAAPPSAPAIARQPLSLATAADED